MRHRPRPLGALTLLVCMPLLGGAGAVAGNVDATVTGLRSAKGDVLACLTAKPRHFPNCDNDADARKLTVPAHHTLELDFGPVPEGQYAIALIHDENANGKLDKRLFMPREGFGFSMDAPVRLGPPSFRAAAFRVGADGSHQNIKMRYLF